jgi:hypothetical protein
LQFSLLEVLAIQVANRRSPVRPCNNAGLMEWFWANLDAATHFAAATDLSQPLRAPMASWLRTGS